MGGYEEVAPPGAVVVIVAVAGVAAGEVGFVELPLAEPAVVSKRR